MKPLRIHGIPVHPVLVHFPVAGWTAATFLAVFALFTDQHAMDVAARWCNVAGIVTGVGAMVMGFLELPGLPREREVRDAVTRHFLLAGAAWTAYLVMLFLQLKALPLAAALAGIPGFVLLLFAGHAGARLVYRLGLPGIVSAHD